MLLDSVQSRWSRPHEWMMCLGLGSSGLREASTAPSFMNIAPPQFAAQLNPRARRRSDPFGAFLQSILLRVNSPNGLVAAPTSILTRTRFLFRLPLSRRCPMPVGPDSASTARPVARRFTDPLPRDLIDDIASIGRVRRVGARSHVCHEGEPCDSFCVVRKGIFRVQLAAPDGRSHVRGQLVEGASFGEAALDAGSRRASVGSCSRGVISSRAQSSN